MRPGVLTAGDSGRPPRSSDEIPGACRLPGLPKPAPVADTPVRLSETPGGIRHRAPLLGEHTDEVLREIGYDDEAIAALRDAGVV